MKGGGLVVVVFVIVFIFLFVCALWGISAIVGGIGRAFSSKTERAEYEKRLQAGQQVLEQEVVSLAPVPPVPSPSAAAEMTTEPERAGQDSIDHVLKQLERISLLRKDEALTNEEFAKIKEKLIQNLHHI